MGGAPQGNKNERFHPYPNIVIADEDGAPPALVDAVHQGLKTFRFEDPDRFPPVLREVFRNQRRYGLAEAQERIRRVVQKRPVRAERVPTGEVVEGEPVYRLQIDERDRYTVLTQTEALEILGLRFPSGERSDKVALDLENSVHVLQTRTLCSLGQALFDHVPEIQDYLPVVDQPLYQTRSWQIRSSESNNLTDKQTDAQ